MDKENIHIKDNEGRNKEVEVDAEGLPPNMDVLDDEGAANAKADPVVDVEVIGLKENTSWSSKGAAERSVFLQLLLSILGTKPPPIGGDVAVALEVAGALTAA